MSRRRATGWENIMAAAPQSRDVETLVTGFAFIEGPRWHDERLYFSDMYTHRVHALERGTSVTAVCEVAGQPSGIAFTPGGDMLVVSMTDRRILRVRDGALEEVADLHDEAPFHLNDMVVDA